MGNLGLFSGQLICLQGSTSGPGFSPESCADDESLPLQVERQEPRACLPGPLGLRPSWDDRDVWSVLLILSLYFVISTKAVLKPCQTLFADFLVHVRFISPSLI